VILAGFGLLLITSGAQTSRNAVAVQASRDELVTQIDARALKVEAIRARIVETRRDVARLETRFLETTSRGREISTRLTRLGTRTGLVAVEGPGVRVEVDDAPNATGAQQEVLDEDLQKLVNALWASGAEAISVNGQRLTNLSAIRHAGSAITVNYRSLSRPYVVLAIGDPNAIPARFVETRHGASGWIYRQPSVCSSR